MDTNINEPVPYNQIEYENSYNIPFSKYKSDANMLILKNTNQNNIKKCQEFKK